MKPYPDCLIHLHGLVLDLSLISKCISSTHISAAVSLYLSMYASLNLIIF
jgi:hypothetical protein